MMMLAAMILAASQSPAGDCLLREAPAEAGRIAYRDCGHGPVVLVIPGGPGLDADYVAPLAAMIADTRHRAVVIEPRGTGASRAAIGDGSRLTVAGSIADVDAVRRANGADRVIVLGHSFGGAVAQAYAAAFPRHVAGLILLDSVGPNMQPPKGTLESWRLRATPEQLRQYDAARAHGDRITAMRLKFRIGFYHRARGEAFDAALKERQIHLDVGALAEAYARDYHVAPRKQVDFPVTLITGDIDWTRGAEPALRTTYPAARSIIVPRAGHFPWADAPNAFRSALQHALERARASTSREPTSDQICLMNIAMRKMRSLKM